MPLQKGAGLKKQRHVAGIAYFPVAVVKPADIGRQIHRGRTGRDEFIYQVREECFQDVLSTLQQGMSMDALGHAFANL
jgi:hypothetical protein